MEHESLLDRMPGGRGLIPAGIAAAGIVLAMGLRKALPPGRGTVILLAALVAAFIFAVAWPLNRWSRYSRKATLATAAILTAGLFAPILFMTDARFWTKHVTDMGMYDLLFLTVFASTPGGAAGWCSSDRSLVGGALVYALAGVVTGALGGHWL